MQAVAEEVDLTGKDIVLPEDTDTKAELVRRVVDVLALPAGRLTANERAFAADILGAVLLSVDAESRAEVSRRLAAVGVAPPALLRQLVLDLPAVAVPLLTEMTEVPEAVLVEAANASHEHRQAICQRDGLTAAVADALLAAGEPDVTAAVLALTEVPLAAPRVEALMQRSRNEVALRRPLLKRPELQPAQGLAMFWWCDAATRQRILSRFSLDRTALQDTLQPLFRAVFTDDAPDPLVKRMLTLIDRRHRPRGRNNETVTMDVVERTLTVARAAPNLDLCEGVGLLAGVSTDTATKVMYDPGGEPFSVLCKSIGVSRTAFAAILEGAAQMAETMGSEGPGFDEERRERLVATFDVIARDYSRTVLRYWDWRPETAEVLGAPSLVEADADEAAGYLGAV